MSLPVREQALIVEAITAVGTRLPFPLLGLDTDNDSAFMNDTLWDYCQQRKLELTRSRAYHKNDQAWVEQKNGAVVRKLVGYGRLEGLAATAALRRLYEASRLYVNFFQPSFKLKDKEREGAKVRKHYEAPQTPYQRLLHSEHVTQSTKHQLRQQFDQLDPVLLLKHIRDAQAAVVGLCKTSRRHHCRKTCRNLSADWQLLGAQAKCVRRINEHRSRVAGGAHAPRSVCGSVAGVARMAG